jgi:hypothetical protein
MKSRMWLLIPVVFFLLSTSANADIVYMKDGSTFEGVIKKVVAGQVVIEVGEEAKVFDILAIESMDFTTPHLVGAPEGAPIDHFLKDVEAQEIVDNMQRLEISADEIEKLLTQIRTYWLTHEPITSDRVESWEAAKESFRKPLSRYQEVLNDLYFHVLAKVDEYNSLMKDATKVYVGVKGPFNIGSHLVSKDMRELPLKKYVPAAWYDTIFYDGYNVGYDDAYAKFATKEGTN